VVSERRWQRKELSESSVVAGVGGKAAGGGGGGDDGGEGGGEESGEQETASFPSLPGMQTGPAMGVGMGVGWAKGQGLAAPMNAGLTVDVTRVAAFEAALQIVEYVKGLEAEREAELCSAGGSPASTPGNSPESARAWTSLRLGGQQ
jgi:hypothetical protein